MSRKLFGTDGIRGLANQYPMTSEVALSVGRALVHLFRRNHRPLILIGKDTRLSGYMLETALATGICSNGGDVLLVGPMPTPAVAFLTESMRADAGVMISASHNPYHDNGIKIFDRHGYKLPDEQEHDVENLVLTGAIEQERPTAESVGRITRIRETHGRYIEFAKSTFPKGLSLEGMKIVLDCAHGASYVVAPIIFRELGATVTVLGAEPNGLNINDGCGAMHPEIMAAKVKELGADIGIALDGDADRAVFADESGRIVDGDAILCLCATDLKSKGQLRNDTLVATVMTNKAAEEYLGASGIRLLRTCVGDRYVLDAMKEQDCVLGGEASGHIIFRDHAKTGDGIVSALQVLRILKEQRKGLSALTHAYQPFPQILQGVKVRERKNLLEISDLQQMVQKFESSLGRQGRILIRYSGTEPLVRVMVEGNDSTVTQRMANDLSACVEKHLGVGA